MYKLFPALPSFTYYKTNKLSYVVYIGKITDVHLPTYPVETPIAQGVTSFIRKSLCKSRHCHKCRDNCNNVNAYFHHLYFFLITAKLTL